VSDSIRVGLIADTHIPEAGPDVWDEVLAAFEGVDLILHGGDITVSRVLDTLEAVAPVYAAEGNHDIHLAADPRIEPVHHLTLAGHRVALVHRFGPVTRDIEWLLEQFVDGPRPDVVVCGDSHYERIDQLGDVLVINPGSPTLPRNMSPRLGHVGMLTLTTGESPVAEIIDLADGAYAGLMPGHPPFA
jgi:putative phosphoesterase